jgi:hypothetical protein
MSPLETIDMVRSAGSALEIGTANGEPIDSEGTALVSFVVAKLQDVINALNEKNNPACFNEPMVKPDLTEFE